MMGVRLLVFVLCLKRTVCLASSTPPLRIASLNKNGGNVKYFDLVAEENTNPPSRKNGDGNDKTIRSIIKNPRFVVTTINRQMMTAIRTTFLPTGFPGKTPPGYLQFSMWSWIQDVSTQLRSVLATQKILEGVGVGVEGATALSALFNYLVRDGCGMAASKRLIDRFGFLPSSLPIAYSYYMLYLTFLSPFLQTFYLPMQHRLDFAQMLRDGEYLLTCP